MDTKDRVDQRPDARERTTQRKSAKSRPAGPRDPKKEMKNTSRSLQDINYIPPKPLIASALVLRLASVVAIVLALVLAMALFFRVEHIQVSGMEQYTAWDISQASGVEKGDSLFSLEVIGAAARIQEKLDYVQSVRIGVRLPNMVIIEIKEVRVTYGIKDQSDTWWLVDSSGRVIEKAQDSNQEHFTQVLGVQLLNPEKGEQATALENTNQELDADGNPIPVTVTAAQRLAAALKIATYLEANSIIGQAASLDVSDLGNLQFWYGEQYQVKLGDEDRLSYKVSLVKGAINKLSSESHNSGVLEVFLHDKENTEDGEVKYTRFQ